MFDIVSSVLACCDRLLGGLCIFGLLQCRYNNYLVVAASGGCCRDLFALGVDHAECVKQKGSNGETRALGTVANMKAVRTSQFGTVILQGPTRQL